MPRLRIGEWFTIVFIVAIFYVLVRPQSKAAELLTAVGQLLKALVSTVTDTAK
jgi:preprotein translocase subunit YajC